MSADWMVAFIGAPLMAAAAMGWLFWYTGREDRPAPEPAPQIAPAREEVQGAWPTTHADIVGHLSPLQSVWRVGHRD